MNWKHTLLRNYHLKKFLSLLLISTSSSINAYNAVLSKVFCSRKLIKYDELLYHKDLHFVAEGGCGGGLGDDHLHSIQFKDLWSNCYYTFSTGKRETKKENHNEQAETWVLISVVKPLQSILRGLVWRKDHTYQTIFYKQALEESYYLSGKIFIYF